MRFVVISIILLVLAGCTQTTPTTEAVLATATPASPTEAVPTPTHTASATPRPSSTPTEEPCNVQSQTFVQELGKVLAEWDDATLLASNTARIALSPAIASLQEIRRKVAELQHPDCAGFVATAAEDYMQAVIEYDLAFMRDDNVLTRIDLGKDVEDKQELLTMAYRELQIGQKLPTRTPTVTPTPTSTPLPGKASWLPSTIGQPVPLTDVFGDVVAWITLESYKRGDAALALRQEYGAVETDKPIGDGEEFVVTSWTVQYLESNDDVLKFYPYIYFDLSQACYLVAADAWHEAVDEGFRSEVAIQPGDTVTFFISHVVNQSDYQQCVRFMGAGILGQGLWGMSENTLYFQLQ